MGYEGRWPDDANSNWAAGTPGSPSELAAFVAHPPLGKWVIALGLALLGPENPAGWRLGTALAGIALVGLVMVLAHLLLGRLVLTGIAGLLIAIDGNAIVMSRVALLDGVLALLVVLAVILLVLDRRQVRGALDAWLADRRAAVPGRRQRSTDWGPALWGRPWLVAAGIVFGLAIGVKWSALYLLAAFAVLTVVADAIERRRAGIALWASGTLLRQAPISAILLLPSALAAHLLTWTGWFMTSGGYGRAREVTDDNRLAGPFGLLPDALQNWWAYQVAIYGYHVGVTSEHNYEAPAIGWPLLLRPTYMHYIDRGDGTAEAISGIPNPLIWYLAVAAVVALVAWAVVELITRGRAARTGLDRARIARPAAMPASGWAIALVLTGVVAGWLPWLLYPERTMFFFYTIVLTPFLLLALTIMLGAILGPADASPGHRRTGRIIVIGMLALAALISLFFLPLWTGAPIPIDQLRLRYWLPTWV
nr:glycosyltransferase family 39 protein [Microcella frigidaquae]